MEKEERQNGKRKKWKRNEMKKKVIKVIKEGEKKREGKAKERKE